MDKFDEIKKSDIVSKIENKIGICFNNKDLILKSLIHKSFLVDHSDLCLESNERLEFLGDAVLEIWITNILFNQFPGFNEGQLTRLRSLIVCNDNLIEIAKTINLYDYLLVAKSEDIIHYNQSVLANAFEALTAAIYLDQGSEVAYKFLADNININEYSSKNDFREPKSIFNDIAQNYLGGIPEYRPISVVNRNSNKIFEVGVFVNKKLIAKGRGNSRKTADKDAAKNACQIYHKYV